RYGQRGADVSGRPDAVRRRQGLGQHARGPALRRPRANGGAARGHRPRLAGPAPPPAGPSRTTRETPRAVARPPPIGRRRRRDAQPEDTAETPPPPGAQPVAVRRALPHAGQLRRERRLLLQARETRIRDLGGLMLEMYRRDQFRQDLVVERCEEL